MLPRCRRAWDSGAIDPAEELFTVPVSLPLVELLTPEELLLEGLVPAELDEEAPVSAGLVLDELLDELLLDRLVSRLVPWPFPPMVLLAVSLAPAREVSRVVGFTCPLVPFWVVSLPGSCDCPWMGVPAPWGGTTA